MQGASYHSHCNETEFLCNTRYIATFHFRISNRRLVTVVGGDGLLSEVESQTIEVGDVVRLEEDDVVPADLVVLSTSHEHGQGGYSIEKSLA